MTPPRRTRPEDGVLLTRTRQLLRRAGLRARKGLGQHFLVDDEALGKVVDSADLSPDDIIVEVGPGLGALTRELASRVDRVMAVELDNRLATMLKESLATLDNVSVINDDILRIDLAGLLKKEQVSSYKVVANLPYYITSPVLRHFLDTPVRPKTMVVMVQKEVAKTIAASPGQMSLLSVSVQFYGRPEIVSYVPADSFYPAPEVDSAILKISVPDQPRVAVSNEERFFNLVRAGFSVSRKQLVNSLALGLKLPKTDITRLLNECGIDTKRRAETLSIEEWAHLSKVYSETYD